MVRKIAPALVALVPFWASLALGACGGDECTRADDHKVECLPDDSSSSSTTTGGGSLGETCAGSRLCQSQCINKFTCEQINGRAADYTACMTECLTLQQGQ
jgi:hypothetical protein